MTAPAPPGPPPGPPKPLPPGVELRRVAAADTRPLRQAVLRPHQAASELVYPGDDAPDTGHFAAFLDGRLVGTGSVYREPAPAAVAAAARSIAPETDTHFRLRGMATAPDLRRAGLGSAILRACIDFTRSRGGAALWFNARVTAAEFYRAHGFTAEGGVFEPPGLGPHVLMWRGI